MKSRTDTYLKISIVLLVIVLILFGFILWRQFAHEGRAMPFRVSLHLNLQRHSGPLPVSSATNIQTWMTFDYINYLFGLPSNYLKTTLGITSAAYPRISIEHYAASGTTTENEVLSAVQQAILNYHPATTTSNPASAE